MAKKKPLIVVKPSIRSKELLKAKIQSWEGVNKYIVDKLKKELEQLENKK